MHDQTTEKFECCFQGGKFMGLRINTNVPALIAMRNLRTNRSHLDHNFEKLSSGLKINHAGDDAAGLAISEGLRAELRSLAQTERNVQDGISVIQIAEGSLSEISNILIRLREIGVQGASDTINQEERKFLNIEFQQLLEEVDRIASTTEFNRVPLLNGMTHIFDIQVGSRNNPSIDRIRLFDSNTAEINSVSLGLNLMNVGDKRNAQNSLDLIDRAISSIISLRSHLGAIQNRLQSTSSNLMANRENMASAMSRIRDIDIAEETAEMTKNNILLQSGIFILTQANSTTKSALGLLGQGGSN